MPAYTSQDQRHPVNRCRLMHRAAIEAWGEAATVPTEAWRLAQVKVFGAKDRRELQRDASRMEDLGMILVQGKAGVHILPVSKESLPLILEDAAA